MSQPTEVRAEIASPDYRWLIFAGLLSLISIGLALNASAQGIGQVSAGYTGSVAVIAGLLVLQHRLSLRTLKAEPAQAGLD